MVKCRFMCSCYDPPFREEVEVKAPDFDAGWLKAKRKAARKHSAKLKNIDITSSYWELIPE